MTKKDGDKLRETYGKLDAMALVYEQGCDTEQGIRKIQQAIMLTLGGRKFRIITETTRVR